MENDKEVIQDTKSSDSDLIEPKNDCNISLRICLVAENGAASFLLVTSGTAQDAKYQSILSPSRVGGFVQIDSFPEMPAARVRSLTHSFIVIAIDFYVHIVGTFSPYQ